MGYSSTTVVAQDIGSGRRRESRRYSAPALERGLRILEHLAESRYPLTLTELAERMRRSSSELFRVLNVLERERYVMRSPESGTYSLNFKFYTLAHARSPIDHLLTAAWYPMNEFCQAVEESCHLSILIAEKMMVVQQVSSSADVHVSIEKGAVYSVVGTASGRLLLSQLPEREREAFLAGDQELRRVSKTRRMNVVREIKRAEKTGFSDAIDETAIGLRDLVVPVTWPVVGMSAALASTFLYGGLKERNIERRRMALHRCSEKISKNLGIGE